MPLEPELSNDLMGHFGHNTDFVLTIMTMTAKSYNKNCVLSGIYIFRLFMFALVL